MTKQKLIVMDIDGTFANSVKWQNRFFNKNICDEAGYHNHLMDFPVNDMLLEMVRVYIKEGYRIMFLSARPVRYYPKTVKWFENNTDRRHDLFNVAMMHNCNLVLRSDESIPSPEWKVNFLNGICVEYDIGLCVDDSPYVCKALREAGYNVLQMNSGAYNYQFENK
jgi:uncharacterized HAD superfamily protein